MNSRPEICRIEKRLTLRIARPFAVCASLAALIGLFACAVEAPAENATAVSLESLEMSGYQLSFAEEFDGPLSVSAWGCNTRWIAHTPWRGDFGDQAFADPEPGFPFTVKNGILTIEARRGEDGRWRSGMLSTWDVCGSGEVLEEGYFEIRLKLPSETGFWPSFWLIGVNSEGQGTAEIDVFEYHTGNSRFSTGIIKHPGTINTARIKDSQFIDIPSGLLSERFNTFGAELTDNNIIIYLNREEVWRTETLPEFRQPFFLLISFPVMKSDIKPDTPQSVTMEIDYVRVYQRPQ